MAGAEKAVCSTAVRRGPKGSRCGPMRKATACSSPRSHRRLVCCACAPTARACYSAASQRPRQGPPSTSHGHLQHWKLLGL